MPQLLPDKPTTRKLSIILHVALAVLLAVGVLAVAVAAVDKTNYNFLQPTTTANRVF